MLSVAILLTTLIKHLSWNIYIDNNYCYIDSLCYEQMGLGGQVNIVDCDLDIIYILYMGPIYQSQQVSFVQARITDFNHSQ